ncbi:MAG: glycosyltransferase, partial [Nitrospinota bacterium]|nr:glycosyltransferase [Nitrospinota bacterium]
KFFSIYSVLTPALLPLYFRSIYRKADIVHIHLPHVRQFFSVYNFPLLSLNRKRPVVLSFHDMFWITGACHYSLDCDKWKTGCETCPDPSRTFPLSKDRAAFMWRAKMRAMNHSNMTIIVGSEWQLEILKKSPILSRFQYEMIPYATETSIFRPMDKELCRLRFGIPKEADVISFRSVPHRRNFKGHDHIVDALLKYKPKKETYLLTFEWLGGLEVLKDKYKIVDIGWTTCEEMVAEGLNAADLFLMPSTAEGFGLMAIESLACGTPVIVFEGTALPQTIRAPKGGLAVPQNHEALAEAIKTLLEDNALRRKMGEYGIELAREEHNANDYIQRHLDLYDRLIKDVRE